MKNFIGDLIVRMMLARLQFREWREERREKRHTRYIIHKVKTEWIFSGTVRNENGVMQDAGYLRSPYMMNRAQALEHFRRQFPRANILHVDDRNKVITYSF